MRNFYLPTASGQPRWNLIFVLTIVLLISGLFTARSQTIWNGGSFTFTETTSGQQDNITGQTALTRVNVLFNSICEANPGGPGCAYAGPCNTQWAVGNIVNWSTLTYSNFYVANGCNPTNGLPKTYVCHLLAENIYLQITFTSWQAGGPGMSYTRTTGIACPLNIFPTASPASICPGNSSTLSIIATGNIGPVTYNWNPGSLTGSNVNVTPGATTAYTVTGTDGSCTATASVTVIVNPVPIISSVTATPSVICVGGNSVLTATMPAIPAYCTAGANTNGCNTGDEAISNVTFGSINNTSGCPVSGQYQNFTGLSTTVSAGSSYPISITNLHNFTGDQVSVWVDWNQNGLFTDPGETYTLTYSTITTGSIAVPGSAINGPTTMRVRLNFTGAMSPCGSTSFGEVEDYSVLVTGGQPAPVFSWSPATFLTTTSGSTVNAVGVTATTTYTVTVTSSGCTATATASISTTVVNINCSGTNVSCNGGSNGSASVSATGTGPFTYVWSNGYTSSAISGLTAGTYCVTVTDGLGCTGSCCYTVTQPAVLTASAVATNASCPLCPDGTVSISSNTGGTPPYSYFPSNPRTGLLPGNYCITVTDANGCTTSACATVGAAGCTLNPNITLNNNVSCFGGNNGSATVTPAGGIIGPFSYSWDNGNTSATANNLNAGNHVVVVTDNGTGCVAQGNITITQPPILTASCGGTNTSCFGGSNGTASVTANGGTPSYTYLWSNASTSSSISGLTPGTYCVTVTDSHGCTSTCCFTVTQPAAITITGSNTNVVCAESPTGEVSVTVSGGTPSYSFIWSNGSTSQNITGVLKGTYTVTVTDANGCTATQSRTISCTDNTPPVLSAGAAGGSLISTDFESGSLPVGWSVTGMWHVTTACASGTPPNPTHWAYYGQDGLCTYNNGSTNSGDLTSNTVSIPAAATSATLSFRYIYNGEGGAPPTGFDNASFKVSQNGGSFNQAMALSTTGSNVWLTANINMNAFIGSTVALQWNFSTQDGIANDFLGLQIDSVNLQFTNTQQCPNNITVSNTPNTCGANVSWTPPTATDNCAVTLTSNHNPGDFFPIGTTAVNYTAADGCGNSTACSFNVSVNDVQPPVITCPGTITTDCNGVATYTVTATDNCSGVTTSLFSGLASGSIFPIGTTLVTWNALDASNNPASCSFNVVRNPAISISETHSNVLCNGQNNGSIDITPSGGSGVYSYNWSNGSTTEDISGLPAGTYTVTVTDSQGCTGALSISISQPVTLTSTSSQVNVSCFGNTNGSATALPSGGTPPYNYSWSNGGTTQTISGLTAGTYNCTITDAHGCVTNTNITITQPTQLIITETHVQVSCFGGSNGSIDITLLGGTPPFTFNWSNGATTEDISGLTPAAYSVTVTQGNGCTQILGTVNITQPSAISVSSAITQPTTGNPNGGAINITVNGGTPAYSYSWSNGSTSEDQSGLSAGTYTVTVTDANGCTKTSSSVLLQPTVSVTLSVTNVSCSGGNNGSVTSTAIGGAPPYTYSWSNSTTTQNISGLTIGTYTVTVMDAISNIGTASIVVSEPEALVPSGTPTNIVCRGINSGSITMAPTGGTPPYAYLWNNGSTTQNRSSLAAGTYTVTVKDAHLCSAVASFTITQPATIMVINTNKTNVRCNGGINGSITAAPSGGTAPYSYSWNTVPVVTTATITGLVAGAYTCTVTDGAACVKSIVITITEPPAIAVFQTQSNVTFPGGNNGSASVSVSGGTPGYTYSWNTIPTQTTAGISGLTAGTYKCTITDSKNCVAKVTFVITQPVSKLNSKDSETNHWNINVKPNPSTGRITVEIKGMKESEKIDCYLVSLDGRIVYESHFQGSLQEERMFDFTSLAKGIYQIQFKSETNNMIRKIIIQ